MLSACGLYYEPKVSIGYSVLPFAICRGNQSNLKKTPVFLFNYSLELLPTSLVKKILTFICFNRLKLTITIYNTYYYYEFNL